MSNHFIVLIIVLVVAAVGATIVIIWAAKVGSKKTPKEIESQKKAEEYANNKVTVIKVGDSYPQPISKYVTQYDFERRSSYGANLPQKRDRVMCFNGKLVFKGPESEMSLFDKLYLREVIKNLFAIKELGQEVIEDKINILLGTKIDRNKNKIFLDLASFLKLDNYYVYLFHNNSDEVCEYLNYFCKTRATVYKNLPETRFENNHNNCVAIFDKNLISEEDLRLLCYIVLRKLKTSGAYCESILSPYSVLNKKGIEFENSLDYCTEYVYKAIADSINCSIFPDTDIAAEIFMRVEGYTGWPAPYELITQLYNLRLEMHNSGYKPLYYHAEADLFNLVKKYYPDAIYQYHHQWLGRQSLDIYIPSIKIAIEFQGKQHYESVGYFGGKSTYQKNTKRDSIKKELCEKQGVKYLEWSFEPCLGGDEMLYIVDGRRTGIQSLIEKIDDGKPLTDEEKQMMEDILKEPIDAIAYESKAYPGGENFIFLEKGFKKLALRELRLRFGRKDGGSHNFICCAFSSDYTPFPKAYGEYFMPKCRVERNLDYENSAECIERLNNINAVLDRKFNRKKHK